MDMTIRSDGQSLPNTMPLCSSVHCSKVENSKVVSAGRSVPTSTKGPSGVRERDIMIFICLDANFLLWGKESNDGVLGQSPEGSKGESHLQRTAACSWGIPQGSHHTALWSDKKQSPPEMSTRPCLPAGSFSQTCVVTVTPTSALGTPTHHSLPLPPLFTILLFVSVHLLLLFWSDVVGSCFDVLQSLCVASTLLL